MDSLNRSISCHVRTTIQILFKSSICFASTATKSEHNEWMWFCRLYSLCALLCPAPIYNAIASKNWEGFVLSLFLYAELGLNDFVPALKATAIVSSDEKNPMSHNS